LLHDLINPRKTLAQDLLNQRSSTAHISERFYPQNICYISV